MSTSNKPSRDQIQKLALGVIGVLAMVYLYFSFFLGPLNKSRTTMEGKIADLQGKLDGAQPALEQANKLERTAGSAMERFTALRQSAPEGAALAWFPPRIKAFFAAHQIDRAVARLSSTSRAMEELPDWETNDWMIEVPQADYATFGKTVAALENAEPLLSIARLNIRSMPEDPEFQRIEIAAQQVIEKK